MFGRNFQASEGDEDADREVVGRKRRVQSCRSSGSHGLFFDSICIKKFSNSRVAAKVVMGGGRRSLNLKLDWGFRAIDLNWFVH